MSDLCALQNRRQLYTMEAPLQDLWALLFLDDDDDDAVTTVSDVESERGRKMARKRRARYRDKLRDERSRLRRESVELEGRLAALLRPEADQLTLKGGWHGAAARQLKRRMRAEELNRVLRSQVSQASVVAQQLQHVWLTMRAQTPSPLALQPRGPTRPVEVSALDVSRVASMAAELEAMYMRTDAVLSGCERPTTPSQPCTWEIQRRWDPEQDMEYVEVVESRTVPFALKDAVAAAQHALVVMLTKEYPIAVIDSQAIAGATGVKFVVDQDSLDGHPAETQVLFLGRVFVEAGRAVLCWQSVSIDLINGDSGPEFYEHGWGVARPLAFSSPGSSGTKFTFRTRYSMAAPAHQPLPSDYGRLFEKFIDIVTEQPEKEAADWLEAMESAVLDGIASLHVGNDGLNVTV